MAPSIPSQDGVVQDVPIRDPSQQSVDRVTDKLETPSLDNRSYRVVRLANQLECLLVHDPETDKASAALDVNVGNFSDEDDMPGLAHAVEHVLFMGTKKYPVENAYNQYLSAHSGYSNAYTGATSTNHFFEVGAKPSEGEEASEFPLYGALDRFAQFFIEPLFLSSTLDRELQAVDSENKENLQSDRRRLRQLEKSLSNPKHPYCHFSTGNFEVLKTEPESRGINVRAKFMEFHEKHYSANRMKLCVLGREPLDVLERWVAELFSAVPNKNLSQNRWEDETPYAADQLKWQIFAKPVMDVRQLILLFPSLDEEELYESQPSLYISHLIGHEGPGSIFYYIKSKGWASSLNACMLPVCPGTAGIFRCEIELTKVGLKNYEEIVKAFFQYTSLLRETSPQEWIFKELKDMADIGFKYQEKEEDVAEFTCAIAADMQKPLPREWLLSRQDRLRKFDADLIAKGLDCLRPDNLNMVLVSRDYPGDWDQKEKWYGTEYKAEKIPEEFLMEISKVASADAKTRLPQLHLPHKNQLIPTKLEVEKKEVKEPALAPCLLRNDNVARTWFKKDDTFWVPKAFLTVSCKNHIIFATAENWVKASLYTSLVEDDLEEYSYAASLAGLHCEVALDSQGLIFKVWGYDENLPVLLKQVLMTIRDLEIRGDRFDIAKERASCRYKNWELQQPYLQTEDYILWLALEHYFVADQLEAELPGVTIESMRAFHKQFISQMHIEAYVHGNLYREDALKLTTMIENMLKPRVLPKDQLPIRRSLIFPAGANYLYKKTLKDPENFNHCIEYYLHIGSRGNRMVRAKTQLLDQIMHEPAFDQLRTKEQLGYDVSSGLQACYTTYGFRFIIQSERASEYLESRIDSFLSAQANALSNMSDTEFERHKRAVVVNLLKKEQNLNQENERHWAQIANEYYDFEAAQEDATHVKQLTKSDMIDFYSAHILPSSPTRAKLVVYLEAQGTSTKTQEAASAEKEAETVPNNGTVPCSIKDVREYKSQLVASSGARPIRRLL
ncbi:alpha/beta-hydrolase [Apiospora arundinis]